jgi:hypothetical protein
MNTHPQATAIAAAIAGRADPPVYLGVRSCRMNVTALGHASARAALSAAVSVISGGSSPAGRSGRR